MEIIYINAQLIFYLCLISILAFIILIKLDAKVFQNPFMNDSNNVCEKKRKRRFRSLSVSMDLEYFDHIQQSPLYNKSNVFSWTCPRKRSQLNFDRLRTFSSTSIEKFKNFPLDSDLLHIKNNGLAILQSQPDIFPFEALPDDCKIQIFSNLSSIDKCSASKVCHHWNALIKTSYLWSDVDFTILKLCNRCNQFNQECGQFCYFEYRNRMKKFFKFLMDIRPPLQSLKFNFDIGDHHDGWLELIQNLIRLLRCQELEDVQINWKETTEKPFIMNKNASITWSSREYNDFIYSERKRQRIFVKFFDFLTAACPNIVTLSLPFDWSERSLHSLSRLTALQNLTLGHYFRMQSIQQYQINMILNSLLCLKYLTIQTKVPNGFGFQLYTFSSRSLISLNIAECSGISIGQLALPNLTSIYMSTNQFYGPFVDLDTLNPQCLLNILAEGCPKLKHINNFNIGKGLSDSKIANEFDAILFKICSCNQHYNITKDSI